MNAKDAIYVLGGLAVVAFFIVRQRRSSRFRERSLLFPVALGIYGVVLLTDTTEHHALTVASALLLVLSAAASIGFGVIRGRTIELIVRSGERYAVRDLDSTNGIFVNGQRANNQVLEDGDILHVAHVEFCFRHPARPEVPVTPRSDDAVERTQMLHAEQPDSLIRGTELLREMIRTEAVEIAYQPIVDLRTRTVVAYEALESAPVNS